MRPRVLVADDDPSVRLLFETTLADEGYEVVCVGDGEEAMNAAREERFDLIFLDVMMPRVNGVMARLDLKDSSPDTPVVLITAWGLEDAVRPALAIEKTVLMKKPFDDQEILRTAQEWTDKERHQSD